MKALVFVLCAAVLLLAAGCTQQGQAGGYPAPVPPSPAPQTPAPSPSVPGSPGAPNQTQGAQPAPAPQGVMVKASANAQLGQILADGQGMTLYIFTKDEINRTSCYGACAANWPPLLTSDGGANSTVAGAWGAVQRNDSTWQVTFNGMPLYYFAKDKKAGDVNGQGVLGVWFAAQPNMTGFPRPMTLGEAMAIAQKSDCAGTGNLTSSSSYNNATRTWWIDLDTLKAGCSPACVVYESNKSAEVNWRCTGLNAEPKPVLTTYANPTFGQILTNADGMALYVYSPDSATPFSCGSSCTTAWPPLILKAGYTTNVAGLPGYVSSVKRPDGTKQVTYNGMLLYTYAYDKQPGAVGGDGLSSGNWHVVKTSMTTYPPVQQPSYGYGGGGY